MYLMVVTFAFFLGGLFATVIRLELATPAGDLVSADTYNKLFTMHGVAMVFFVLIPAVPAILGNFVLPLAAGRKGRRLSEAEPPELVHLRHRIPVHRVCDGRRRRRHGVDLLHALQQPRLEYERRGDRARRLHHRLLVDPHRPELHGDDPPDAGPGVDLVPAAAVRVGDLRDEPRADPRDAGDRHHRRSHWPSSASSTSVSSTRC